MHVVVSGASGLIGRHLVAQLRARGDRVTVLVRRPVRGPDEVRWDPDADRLDPAELRGVDAAVNLSGAGIGDHRLTPAYREVVRSSRLRSTSTLVRALLAQDERPAALLNASAIGWYGEGGERVLTEDVPRGDDFLAHLCEEWEAAAAPAAEQGVRTALLRTGLLASPDGGSFGRMLTLFRLGLGGRLGSGRQWWSVISMPDLLDAVTFVLDGDLSGPVNLVCPTPARNVVVTRALGRALGRPTLLAVPAPALKVVLGPLAEQVLGSQRVVPQRLLDAGFRFRHPDADAVADWLASA
ncbi:TIGR01777 family oxidoreductase [Kineococcus terrestris]|uniref:TIGR01777 family oxidoreductase n=1 Tax=Kineococcus terrestris TaxID=2044856 RepID=UPI0034DAD6D0